jgi:membrane-associated phospholipid phosphatase
VSISSWIYTQKIVDKYNLNIKPLYDIGHVLLPNLSEYYLLTDFFVSILVIAVFILYYKDTKLTTFILMAMTIFLMKYIIQILTILPDPTVNLSCKTRHNFIFKFIFGNCNDMMFSGHTAISILCLIFLMEKIKGIMIYLYIFLVVFVAILSIAVRNHYTIDVVMAFFVVYFVWHEGKKWFK